ncbi:hypothetical protein LZG74_11300 [Dyadobacter sp. CY327]|uniref:hypothetical protein n=1 Tax=Dyadobacter sp. CY327 TaxID=2907301 RepID=UPI001F4303DC|nr:hypothetical protein [Dyadobacter sp. CY327]MCE7070893.1 hypothetical protein [Dyadobacter sp. CY327]
MSSRENYIQFLQQQNLQEDDVLPIWPTGFDQDQNDLTIGLLILLNRNLIEANTAKNVLGLLQKNTNDLLQVMNDYLRRELSFAGIKNIPPAFVGVFPWNSFNGRAKMTSSGPLILLTTGFIEMLEATSNLLLAERDLQERVQLLSKLIIDFCDSGVISTTKSLDHPSFRGEAQAIAVSLVSESEFFVLCHEYGHLANGHFESATSTSVKSRKGVMDVLTSTRRKEYEADFWAIKAIVKLARQTKKPIGQVRCGILFFFCLANLIEMYLRISGNLSETDGHPTAVERISHAEKMLIVYGANDSEMWNFITSAHLSLFNLVHHNLFGKTLPWDEMALLPPGSN